MKFFRDQNPIEVDVLFVGQIKNIVFRGVQAEVECVGFEHFQRMPIPRERYQINCNWQLFEPRCGLNKENFKVTTTVTLDSTRRILTSTAFGDYSDGWFVGGLVEFPAFSERRTIIEHTENKITIAYRMINLQNNDQVRVYPGCDGRAQTCRDKFGNLINFLGFPFIPIENPALRT